MNQKYTTAEILEFILEYMADNGTRIQSFDQRPSSKPTGETTVAQIQATGFDSLDEVELVMHLEDQLNSEIADEQAEDIWKPEFTLLQVAERVKAL